MSLDCHVVIYGGILNRFGKTTTSAESLCGQQSLSHVSDSESNTRAFHIPTICILLFNTTCLFRMINFQSQTLSNHVMNSDEVRINISNMLIAGMINVEQNKHTHTLSHRSVAGIS